MNLTPKQQEILRLYAEGYSSKEVQKIIGIAQSTMNNHWVKIMDRLAARTREHAVVIAIKRGLVEVENY